LCDIWSHNFTALLFEMSLLSRDTIKPGAEKAISYEIYSANQEHSDESMK
ncbi:4354_t:CDS:1, partial [Racocetra persica]